MTPKNVTESQLVDFMLNYTQPGAKIVALVTRTRPKFKTGSPFKADSIDRIARRQVTLGSSYEAAVNRQRINEANPDQPYEYFKAESMWKGFGAKHTAVTVYNQRSGKVYFAYRPRQDGDEGYVNTQDIGWQEVATGRMLTEAEVVTVKEWLVPPSPAKKQDVYREVSWRKVELANVVELHYAGLNMVVDHTHDTVSMPENPTFKPTARAA